MIRIIRPLTVICLIVMLLPVGVLWSHTSQDGAVLGRYSLSYFLVLLLYLALLGGMCATLFLPEQFWRKIQAYLRGILGESSLAVAWWVIFGIAFAGLVVLLGRLSSWGPGRTLAVNCAFISFTLWILGILAVLTGSNRLLATLGNLLLLSVSIGIAFVLVEFFLRARPGFIPEPVMQWLPGGGRYLHTADYVLDKPVRMGYRFAPLQDRWVSFDPYAPGVGEVGGTTGPYGEGKTEPIQLHFVTDENGFLNNPPVNGKPYDIVIVGDSFLGLTAEVHWIDLLSQLSGKKVLSLGNSGWGGQAEVEALKQFGVDKGAKWVVMAYFEGNDLWDAQRYEEKAASGLDWIEHDLENATIWQTLVTPQFLRYMALKAKNAISPPDYLYPLELQINDRTLKLELTEQYVGVASATTDLIEPSRNLALTKRAILEARQAALDSGARFVLLYIPSEPHVYIPFLQDPALLERVALTSPAIDLNEAGYLRFAARPVDPKTLRLHLDDQMQAVESFARQEGIEFLNLTPRFSEEAGKGVELYNYADTHWNAAGHTLAAQVLADYILNNNP